MIPGHLFWKYQRLIGIYYKIIAGHSGSLEPHDLQYFAVIVHSVRARIALAAYNLWLYGHFVAHLAGCHVLARLHDLCTDFVSLDDRITGIRVLSVIDMYIGSADADSLHLYFDLIRLHLRDVYLLVDDVSWFRHNCLCHFCHADNSFSIILFYQVTR